MRKRTHKRSCSLRLIRQAKIIYIEEQDNYWGDDSKNFWDNMRRALPGDKEQSKIIPTDGDGKMIPNERVSDRLTKHFTGIGVI